MYRMVRCLDEHPDYLLVDSSGTKVKNWQGFYVFDHTKPEVQKWWMSICLNATKYANGDGCFCWQNYTFIPSPPESKQRAWPEGLQNLTCEVQDVLGEDKLLIGKVVNQSYVKAVQLEFFQANNDSINNLMICAEVGQVVQAHVLIKVPCSCDLTDYTW